MSDLWLNIVGILGSIGIGGGIVLAFSSWLGKVWAQRILAKETADYKENLERITKQLEQKNYVSRVCFDTEFAIYRELCLYTDEMERRVYELFPYGLDTVPADKEKEKELLNERYKNAHNAYVDSSKKLAQNSAFIPGEIYQLFWDLHDKCRLQVVYYPVLRGNDANNSMLFKKEDECFKRTNEIEQNYKELQEALRNYLKNLDVNI